MPIPPANDPFSFDRSKIRRPSKSSMSPVLKIVLVVLGGAFLMCAGCTGFFFLQGVYEGVQKARNRAPNELGGGLSGEAAFRAANLQITSRGSNGTSAWGNSEEARQLAEKFSTDIRALREAFFTKRKKKPVLSLSDGEFLTYCHLDNKACVFLVHVPDLRKFTADARSDLADLAWATAQDVARSNLQDPPPRLAIGTRGILLYDAVLTGSFQPDESSEEDGILTRESGDRAKESLYVYFKPDSDVEMPGDAETPVTDEMPGADELESKPADDEAKPEAAPETSLPGETVEKPRETERPEP